MVRLDRIYTKSGDSGTTGLGDGSRLPKHHVRISAYGTSDELSSVLGLLVAEGVEDPLAGWIKDIQNDLFDVGADLCVPGCDAKDENALRVTTAYTDAIEKIIDEVNDSIPPLKTFVLPGGSKSAAWLHLARTVCRRAERLVSQLVELDGDNVNPEVLRYLNRLSDLFFVLSRYANDNGKLDNLWRPGARRS